MKDFQKIKVTAANSLEVLRLGVLIGKPRVNRFVNLVLQLKEKQSEPILTSNTS